MARYSDFKANLDENPVTGDLVVITDASAVKAAVKNLLLTGQYERRFRPYIGSGLQKYLFENVDDTTARLISDSIATTLSNFEPRAQVISIDVDVQPDMNSYSATVKFAIVNLTGVYTVSQIIRRIR